MGKQGQQQRAALANALGAAGSKPVAPPTLKEEPKPPPVAPKRKPAPAPEQAEPKTRKELEEEQRRTLEERDRQRKEFFDAEAARKLQENLPADKGVTYVEDRDSRKPVAVEDLSEYWVSDLGFLPFMPSDNVGATEVPGGVDPLERLDFLRMLSDQLRQVLRMRFNVFWSQVLHDGQFRRCLDSYLRFCLRRHDVGLGQGEQQDDEDTMGDEEEQKLSREISRRVLAVMIRLSRPQETTHDFISEDKYAEFIYEKRIFDIPKLIDLCAVYGDANRDTVTKLVHSVMSCQPRYREDFEGLVRHMHGGLRQCCAPLQDGGVGGDSSELSVEECLTFLPDILSCFVAMFCFFPEDLVGRLVEARLDGSAGGASKGAGGAALPLADVMVSLHEAVWALKSSMGAVLSLRRVDLTAWLSMTA
ncbi:unnamed protein product [Prorocentrum cordatum]|uniref:Uncharacterized protein n=1 Tax=Prorocentrum cordatum TaxID=2364126 RepID=A0ABN9QJE4_9DINO|nr:unnamed protein product [Polarella glacialis]